MELFKLLGTVAIETDDAENALKNVVGEASSTQGKLETAFDKIGSFAVKAGQVIATGLAAGATAIGALTKSAVGEYADYEQLAGGVETLFGDSSNQVKLYAAEAYKTAGLSANDYMETVTGFSASLLQGLGGDTAKAAEIANLALTDMSDNANKMGTDMSLIQNAYQGFAKQNYTMLDNLKLGYGGTQEEMVRLINDSGVLNEKIESMDGISFDTVINAIHAVQDNIGITGTTASEASTTISGSLSATKASWSNLLSAIAYGNDDLSYWIDSFVESALTSLGNLVPRIATTFSGISTALEQIMPVVSAELPGILEALLPGLITGATALITGLISALPTILQILIVQLPSILSQIGAALVAAFPVLLETVKNLFGQIWDYIALELFNTSYDFETALGDIKGFFENAWTKIQEVWNSLGKPIFDFISSIVGSVRDTFAAKMPEIQGFFSGCVSDISTFWENNLKPCFDAIGDFIENILAPAFETAFNGFIGPAVDNAFNFIKDLWENTLKPVFTGITDFLTGVFTGNWSQAWNGIKSILTGAWNGYKNTINTALSNIKNIVSSILTAIKGVFSNIWNSGVKTVVTTAINNVKTTISNGLNNALTTVSNVLGNIKNKFSSILDGAKTIVKNAIDKIKGFFNFSWSLPHLKLPHISISGSFSLSPLSVPKFGISWYKKAYENAMLLNDPTIFGFSAASGKFLGGGDGNGTEVVAGSGTLMNMIQNAVSAEMNDVANYLERITALLVQFFPDILTAMNDQVMVLDDGTLVAKMAPGMDAALGKLAIKKGRGR